MTQRLLLMRHGKSDWGADIEDDYSRPLNERGTEDALRIAEWLGDHKFLPDRIICSSARRTRETAKVVAQHLAKIATVSTIEDDMLYLCSYGQLLDTIESGMKSCETLLIIAHNPSLDEVVSHLSLEPPARTPTGKLMTTAAVAIFKYDGVYSPYEGELEHLVRPREIL